MTTPSLFPNSTTSVAHTGDDLTSFNISEQVIYPTKSLNFLKYKNNQTAKASNTLQILIVGAGLGGLSAAIALARKGHNINVLEQASKLDEVGAGIQIPSNSARILIEWGLEPLFKNLVVEPEDITFRRWENGAAIGLTKLVPDFRTKYGAPYLVIHRAHFHRALYDLALELGVQIHTASQVVDYDQETPTVTLANSTMQTADLIIASDGIKSTARKHISIHGDDPPRATRFAAYRATVDVESLRGNPETSWLLERPGLNIWIGEDRHVMTYMIASGKSFNMVLSHVDRTDPSTWTTETAIADMRKQFSNWDPCLVKIINMIQKTVKWPLMTGAPRDSYVSSSGKLVLLGDSAHAMLPYMSQGAAMAVEDAAALAEALNHVDHSCDVRTALSVYEKVRAKRNSQMQQASLVNGTIWHFADGPEQRARDVSMSREVRGLRFHESPNQWSDPTTQAWAYGYDAVGAIIAEFGNGVRCNL